MKNKLEKTTETNDLNYPEFDAENIEPMRNLILVQWQLCQETIKLGKITLARPDTHKKMHYTGTVLAIGPDVDPEIAVGKRVAFDQFSNFEKGWDDYYGRVALLQEDVQGALFMLVPERVKFEGSEPEYNYDV